MKNKLILFLVRFFQLWISPNRGDKKILVVSTTALGDSLWGSPAIESIFHSFPNCKISLLTSPIGAEVFTNCPWLHQIVLFQSPFFPLWRHLKKEKFTDIVILHASQRLVLPMCALLGAQTIVATSKLNKGLDDLLTHKVRDKWEHEIERRLDLIQEIGAKVYSRNLSFFLRQDLQKWIEKKTKKIAIHPGSKDGFKRWPKEHFIDLGNRLVKLGYEVLITGSMSEIDLLESIQKNIPTSSLISPSLSLGKFAEIIHQVDLLISNDTGPVHLAISMKKKVIALYSSTDSLRCGPYFGAEAIAIAKKSCCSPCLKRKCKIPFCMMQIGVDEVIEKVKAFL